MSMQQQALPADCASIAEAVTDTNDLVVAFASSDGELVDQHFGSAEAFFVYRVSADEAEIIASKHFGHAKKDGNTWGAMRHFSSGCQIKFSGPSFHLIG